MKSTWKLALLTTTSLISSTILGELPTQAATFAQSETLIRLSDFNLTPQNPDANSQRNAIAFSGSKTSTVAANADGTLALITNQSNETLIDLDFDSDVSGDGNNYFGVGRTFAFTSSNFLIPEAATFSFGFEVNLFLDNIVDTIDDGSVANFSRVTFSLLDEQDDRFLGGLIAVGNLTTNLPSVDQDFLVANATPNVGFNGFRTPNFGSNQESGAISLTGQFSQTFTTATQVRLEVSTLNLSCSQAPKTDTPCTKVPEPHSIFALIVAVMGLGLVSRKVRHI